MIEWTIYPTIPLTQTQNKEQKLSLYFIYLIMESIRENFILKEIFYIQVCV